MATKPAQNINEIIDTIIPKEKVLEQLKTFLDSCDWQLEIDEKIRIIPKKTRIMVQSRAYIKADSADIFDDHFEATILIGAKETSHGISVKHAILVMYFTLEGKFFTEDRYPGWKFKK